MVRGPQVALGNTTQPRIRLTPAEQVEIEIIIVSSRDTGSCILEGVWRDENARQPS